MVQSIEAPERPRIEALKALRGEGNGEYPLSSQLEGLGEHRKLPQWGVGWSPSRKPVLVHFELEKCTWSIAIWYFIDTLNLANASIKTCR